MVANAVGNFFKKLFMKTYIKKLHADAIIPKYQTSQSAGFDIHILDNVIIDVNEKLLLNTGLAVSIPENTMLMIVPRSGLSLKTTLNIANSPGILDKDYTGELKIIAENTSNINILMFNAGDRIAQGIIVPYIQTEFIEVNELPQSDRGNKGFGSTGIK